MLDRAGVLGATNIQAEVLDETPTGDEFLDTLLARLASGKERALADQLRRLATTEELRASVTAKLIHDGVLRTETTPFLKLFSRTTHPEVNPLPERRLRERITKALTSTGEVDERTTLLVVVLAHDNGLLRRAFGADFIEGYAPRIKELELSLKVRHPSRHDDNMMMNTVLKSTGLFG